MRTELRNSSILGAILSTILILSVSYYWPIQESYHPLNSDWNGYSRIFDMNANSTLLAEYTDLPPRSLLVIAEPAKPFSADEAHVIREFLANAGVVVLADDSGTGNTLLEELNLTARFSGQAIADLYSYSKNPSFPVITNFGSGLVTRNVTAVILNRPTYIVMDNSRDIEILAESSPFSFIDVNGTNHPYMNESVSSYVVMAEARIGNGTLVLVGDPGLFMNDMIDLFDNRRIFENLIQMGEGRVFFDIAHLAKAPLTDARTWLKYSGKRIHELTMSSRFSYYIQFLVAAIVMAALSIAVLRGYGRGAGRKGTKRLTTNVHRTVTSARSWRM